MNFREITHRHKLHGHEGVSRQRQTALRLIFFHGARVIVWAIAMLGMGLHFVLPHSELLTSYYHLCQAVAFVTFISLYCNWSTDLSNFTGAIAAFFAADSHHDAEATRATVERDTATIRADVHRLAKLMPSPEGDELAARITSRL